MEIAKFDLSLTLSATAQGLRGGLNYSTDLFERGTIERMLRPPGAGAGAGRRGRGRAPLAAGAAGPEERARVARGVEPDGARVPAGRRASTSSSRRRCGRGRMPWRWPGATSR